MDRALNAMYLDELEMLMADLGEKSFRGRQLFHFFHVERGLDLEKLTVFSKPLRDQLKHYPIRSGQIIQSLMSRDGSKKLLVQLFDGAVVESVFMPYENRNTLCLSTEVGCRMGCVFCASTKAPFQRRLQAEEMLCQVYVVEEIEHQRVDRVVLMGIGEPLDNYEEVVRFLRLLTHPKGKNLSCRSITLSTSGLVPEILRLSEEGLPINLAISLHASTDEKRKKTMPIANQYSIDQLLCASSQYFEKTGRRVTFEYVLIHGENDQEEDLRDLARRFRGPAYHINLLPLNEIQEYQKKSAAQGEIYAFKNELNRRGVQATVRNKRGADIDAACGQLRIQFENMGERE